MSISPQAQTLYKELLSSKAPLSARQLAERLGLFQTVIYRLTEELLDVGLISKTQEYPHKFFSKSFEEGQSLFLLQQNDWFSTNFYNGALDNRIPKSKQISLNFIQSRDELMKISAVEANKANESVDLLRSGHEIPAETMLSLINANKRNILTRMLIQDYSKENAEQIKYWQQNGILVKKTPLRHLRLMIYDSNIVYFMSYKHSDSGKDMGMKITYPPFAAVLTKLFNDWWEKAEGI